MLLLPSRVLSQHVLVMSSFHVSIVALWDSLLVVCCCAVWSLSLPWLHWVCAGGGCSLPLVHGGGGSLSPFVGAGGGPSSSFMSPHCPSIIAVRHLVATLLSVTWHLGIGGRGGCLSWCPQWPTWHLDSKQWGGKVVVYSPGGQKQPDDACCIVSTLLALIWLVTWCCSIVFVLWCAAVIVGS